jgi:TonB family protein
MKKIIVILSILSLTVICNAQTSSTKYFNNEWLEKEVPAEKAKFSKTITQNTDGSITTELKDLKKNIILESYRNEEPIGVWVYSWRATQYLDYNFQLKYSEEKCSDSSITLPVKDYFENDDNIGYKAPGIASGEINPNEFLAKNLIYPKKATESGIQGEVHITFTITQYGNIENIIVTKGVDICLDKETVRVMRELKFKSPPTLKGKPVTICVSMPVYFKLQG